MRSMRLRSRYMRLFQRILALRLDLGGMQERMPASCRLASGATGEKIKRSGVPSSFAVASEAAAGFQPRRGPGHDSTSSPLSMPLPHIDRPIVARAESTARLEAIGRQIIAQFDSISSPQFATREDGLEFEARHLRLVCRCHVGA